MSKTKLRDMLQLNLEQRTFRKKYKARSVCKCCGLTSCKDANGPGFGNTYRCPLRFATVLVQASQRLSEEQ